MPKTLKVGYIQFAPKFGEINENIIKIQKLIKTLPPADLVVLPELCTSGYAFENREEAKKYAEAIPGGRTTRSLENIAKENNIYIIAGI